MSRRIDCHQCKGQTFYILYDAETQNSAAICDHCDATVVYDVIDPPPTRPQASSTSTLDLPPVVMDASGHEGGGPILEAAVRRIGMKLDSLEYRLETLEKKEG